MTGPRLAREQKNALQSFERATKAMQKAKRFDGSFYWWMDAAKECEKLGIRDRAQAVYDRITGRVSGA